MDYFSDLLQLYVRYNFKKNVFEVKTYLDIIGTKVSWSIWDFLQIRRFPVFSKRFLFFTLIYIFSNHHLMWISKIYLNFISDKKLFEMCPDYVS